MAMTDTQAKQDFETAVAIIFIFIVLSSVILNLLVIIALLRPNHMKRLRDKIIISMSFCDLTRIILTGPLEIRGLLSHRFNENGHTCKVFSFFMYFCEYTSIAHLLLIILDRYMCTCKPNIALQMYLDANTFYKEVAAAYSFGLFWAMLPVFGLGTYGFQIRHVQCGLVPLHDVRTKIYITFILVCVNIFSLVIAVACIYKIWKKLKLVEQKTTIRRISQEQEMSNYIAQDKNQLKMVLGLTIMFACTWFVYDVALFQEIYSSNARNEYLEVTTTCIGQSSAMIAPILCLCFYKEVQLAVKQLFVKTRVTESIAVKRQSTVGAPGTMTANADKA